MNNQKQYIGWGKALFPPHPEDLVGGNPCCNKEECDCKKPCDGPPLPPPKKKPCIPKRDYKEEAAKKWFSFR